MKRLAKSSSLLDKMHKGAVWTCIGLTLYGTYLTGLRVYNYFTVIKPMRKQQELELLKEGAPAIDTNINLDTAKELKY